MPRSISFFICAVGAFFFGLPFSYGDWKQARVSAGAGQQIEGLSVESPDIKVRFLKINNQPVSVGGLMIRFSRKDWGLLYKKQWGTDFVKKEKDIYFFKVPLRAERTAIRLGAVSPRGEIETAIFHIDFDGWGKYQDSLAPKKRLVKKSKPYYFSGSLGLTKVDYKEEGVPDFNMNAVTAKVFGRYPLSKNWDLAMNVFLTAFPISDNRSDLSVRFLGINGRIGYALPWLKEPWGLSILGGWYYTTMIVTNNALGFKNLAGPQIYPLLRRRLSGGKSVFAYMKFAPIIAVSYSFDNRELAFGGGYGWKTKSGRPLSLNLDYADFKFTARDTTNEIDVPIKTSSISLSFAYGLF